MTDNGGNVALKKQYKGFRLDMAPEDMAFAGDLLLLKFDTIWFRVTNWSTELASRLYAEQYGGLPSWNRRITATGACRSGHGMFKFAPGILLDADDHDILILRVIDPDGNKVMLVNSAFETPRCPRKWAAIRRHVRKIIMNTVSRAGNTNTFKIKVVKAPPEFMNSFLAQFNYVPKVGELDELKRTIIDMAMESMLPPNAQTRRERRMRRAAAASTNEADF